MNKEQLQQKIVDMEKQLAELKKELEKKDKGIWKPDKCEYYYFVDIDGGVIDDVNEDSNTDDERFLFGNYYKTEEEAEKMSNYLKYTNLLRKYVEEHSEPLDWESNDDKFWISYNYYTRAIMTDQDDCCQQQGTIYASSEEVLRQAIEFVGEENIKKYIFGIEE